MVGRNTITTTLVILSILVLSSSTVALTIPDVETINITSQRANYTIVGDDVVLQSSIGEIRIPITENVKKEMQSQKNRKLTLFGSNTADENRHSAGQSDFLECYEQAAAAVSPFGASWRNWEAFFKRNKIRNTMEVRYCCNAWEFVYDATMTLPLECRLLVRLQDHFMKEKQISRTCRQYEFHSAECLLIRWMYWWIPIVAAVLLVSLIICFCCLIKRCFCRRRSNKEYLGTIEEKEKFRTSLVTGTVI